MVVLHRAMTLIERDALIIFLKGQGIDALTARRDVIQNVTDNPNLSYGGYSALFSGYEIFVEEKDIEAAQALLTAYEKQVQGQDAPEGVSTYSLQKHYERRMIVATLLTIVVPIAAHLILIYLYYSSKRKGLTFTSAFFLRVGITALISAAFGFTLIINWIS